jgi:hypothetical protein
MKGVMQATVNRSSVMRMKTVKTAGAVLLSSASLGPFVVLMKAVLRLLYVSTLSVRIPAAVKRTMTVLLVRTVLLAHVTPYLTPIVNGMKTARKASCATLDSAQKRKWSAW